MTPSTRNYQGHLTAPLWIFAMLAEPEVKLSALLQFKYLSKYGQAPFLETEKKEGKKILTSVVNNERNRGEFY